MQSSGSKHHLNHLFNMHFFFKANKVHKIKAAYINKQNGCYGRLYNSLQEFLLIFQWKAFEDFPEHLYDIMLLLEQ